MSLGLNWRGQLSCIALGVDDPHAATNFYETVIGMTRVGDGEDGDRRLGWGGGDHMLELAGDRRALNHYGLEIRDRRELDGLLERLGHAGVDVTAEVDSAGREQYSLTDPEGRKIRLHGAVDRSGERSADTRRRPIRLQHITFATRALPELQEFYVGTLGMRVSDYMGEVFTWLRCGAEHHTIALVATESDTGLDHFSFDLGGWPDFVDWCDRLATADVPVGWGPGRHGPGNNLFVMFDDPSGHHVELSAEMELYYDRRASYTPRVWSEGIETVNLWGIAPPWRTLGRSA